MRHVDRYAYANRINRLHPGYKAGLAALAIGVCLASGQPAIGLAVLVIMVGLAILWAGVPASPVLRLLAGQGAFLVAGVAGVALSVGQDAGSAGLALGPLVIGVRGDSLGAAATLLARAAGCAAAMNFLALTTPMVAIVDLLRALRVPELLIDLMTLVYRFSFAMLDALERMVQAHEVRMGFSGWRAGLRSSGRIGANLFVETFRRGRRLELALQARAWDGPLRVLPGVYEHPRWARGLVARAAR
jgi:cobalt/nickel transport system permease protein